VSDVTFEEFYRFLDRLVNDLADLHGDIFEHWQLYYRDDYFWSPPRSQEEIDLFIRFIRDCEDYVYEVIR